MLVPTSKLKLKYFFPIFLFVFLFAASTLSFAASASAATLSFSPSPASVTVGNIVPLKVLVNTSGEVINNAEAIIQFPSNLLEVVSVSKSSSIFSLWVEEPIFSNSSGTVKFNGGVANPGFNGSNGSLVLITFRAKAVGTASIFFTDAAIRKNDGLGTDILTGTGQANFTIKAAPVPVKETPPPVEEPETPSVKVTTPVFTDYSDNARLGDFLVVKGSADPFTDIIINSEGAATVDNLVIYESKNVKSDGAGTFTYVSNKAINGLYTITAQARNKDGVLSDKSLPLTISVVPPPAPEVSTPASNNIVKILSTIIPIVGLLILLILLLIWGWYNILFYRERMRKKLADIRNITSKSFHILDEDVKDEIKIFKKIKAAEPLTDEERLFINQFKKDIEAAERAILDSARD